MDDLNLLRITSIVVCKYLKEFNLRRIHLCFFKAKTNVGEFYNMASQLCKYLIELVLIDCFFQSCR